MKNCYNMMTSMNTIENVSIIFYMFGFGGLSMGVFQLLYNDILTSVGYIATTSIL